jgi:predicted enzyme involved in methoxymalonyl-ACP biosynthesis
MNLLHIPKIHDDKKTILKSAKKEVNFWKKVWKQTDKTIIQTTFDPPFNSSLGYDDPIKYGGLHHYIRLINSLLIDSAPSNLSFIDIESLLINTKESSWKDLRMFYLTKQPFNMEMIPALSKAITSRIEGALGISKKVIVSDLDNTLWGGVLGDDGKYGIICDNSSPDGEAYFNFQKYLKRLSSQGIVLTICSKNDEKFVKEVFKDNKNMMIFQ